MAREFDELALDGHNYPTWAMDVKISLAYRGFLSALTPPDEREVPLPEPYKYNALYIIRHHIHTDLKAEYVMEEEPSTLWLSLKNRYEQQKATILPEANHEWTHLRLQDFKSVGDYNHAVHKICAKLRFCAKEPSEEDKIEKTIQTMLPSDRVLQHQYRARNYPSYSELIRDLLQAEKHDELSMKTHHQRPVGSAPPPEVHYNTKGNQKSDNSNNNQKNFKGKSKRKRNRRKTKQNVPAQGKGNSKPPGDKCRKCGCYKHSTKKCHTPRHLVALYQKSLGKGQASGSGYEAHFNQPTQKIEASSSQQVPMEPISDVPPLTVEDYMDTENALVEFNSTDVFGDLL